MGGVRVPDGLGLAGGHQLAMSEVGHGLEESVALAVEDDEGLVNQVRKETQDFPVLERRAGADRFGRAKSEPAGEGGQATEQDPLRVREEVMAPLHGCLERLLAGEGGTGARR